MEKLFEAGNKDVRPNVVALNAVLNACAYTGAADFRTSNRAVEIAHTVLKHVETNAPVYGKPDQITFGTFLKVCATQMPDSSTREKVIDVIFKLSVRDGQVGNFVLQQLQQIASDELYLELVGRRIQDPIDMEVLPKSWWSNVAIEEKKKWRNSNKQQLAGKVDTQSIAEELNRLIKKVKDKKEAKRKKLEAIEKKKKIHSY